MPCGEQSDIEYSDMLINHLGIKSYTMNIYDAVNGVIQQFSPEISVSSQTITNLPARIRTVSYTHLDVYKRQGLKLPGISKILFMFHSPLNTSV